MNIYNEIMKMNSFLKKHNKKIVLDNKSGLIKGLTNDLMPNFNDKKIGRMLK